MENKQVHIKKTLGRTNVTMIPNEVAQSIVLTPIAKTILIYLMSLPETWNINKTFINNHLGMGRDKFGGGWNQLKELGYLYYKKYMNKDRSYSYIWYVEPYPSTENQDTEIQTTENPYTENQTTEIQTTEIQTTENPSSYKEIKKKEIYNKEILDKEINNINTSTILGPDTSIGNFSSSFDNFDLDNVKDESIDIFSNIDNALVEDDFKMISTPQENIIASTSENKLITNKTITMEPIKESSTPQENNVSASSIALRKNITTLLSPAISKHLLSTREADNFGPHEFAHLIDICFNGKCSNWKEDLKRLDSISAFFDVIKKERNIEADEVLNALVRAYYYSFRLK